MDIKIPSVNFIVSESIYLKNYFEFNNKKFKYIDKDITETTSSDKLEPKSIVGSGGYGIVLNLNNKYARKIFISDDSLEILKNIKEELKYSDIVIDNNLKQIIHAVPIVDNNDSVMMPLVDGDLLKFLKNIVKLLIHYKEKKFFDIVIFDIMNSILNILFEASKVGLFYTDLKLKNLLCLGTGPNKFMIVIGDLGSFTYYDPYKNSSFEGYGSNISTYPPFMNNNTKNKHKINYGHVFSNSSRSSTNKNSINNNNKYLDKILVWGLGLCFIRILYLFYDITNESPLQSFEFSKYNYKNIDSLSKEIKIMLDDIHKKIGDSKLFDNMITLISKMLIVNQEERISLKDVIVKFKVFAKRVHPNNSRKNNKKVRPNNSRANATNSRAKANNSRANANATNSRANANNFRVNAKENATNSRANANATNSRANANATNSRAKANNFRVNATNSKKNENLKGGSKYINIKGFGKRKIRYNKNKKPYVIIGGRKKKI